MKSFQNHRVLEGMSFILCICFFISFGNRVVSSQVPAVYVGDTLEIGTAEVPPPGGCAPGEVSSTHHQGSDFFLYVPNSVYTHGPTSTVGYFMFAPQKTGIQCDTFFVTVKGQWNRTYPCGPDTHGGPFIFCVNGISKSQGSVNSSQEQNLENIVITSIIEGKHINISSNFSHPDNTTIEIYDALGILQPFPVSELLIPSGINTQKLEVGSLSTGYYIIRLKMKDQTMSKSFIIVH